MALFSEELWRKAQPYAQPQQSRGSSVPTMFNTDTIRPIAPSAPLAAFPEPSAGGTSGGGGGLGTALSLAGLGNTGLEFLTGKGAVEHLTGNTLMGHAKNAWSGMFGPSGSGPGIEAEMAAWNALPGASAAADASFMGAGGAADALGLTGGMSGGAGGAIGGSSTLFGGAGAPLGGLGLAGPALAAAIALYGYSKVKGDTAKTPPKDMAAYLGLGNAFNEGRGAEAAQQFNQSRGGGGGVHGVNSDLTGFLQTLSGEGAADRPWSMQLNPDAQAQARDLYEQSVIANAAGANRAAFHEADWNNMQRIAAEMAAKRGETFQRQPFYAEQNPFAFAGP